MPAKFCSILICCLTLTFQGVTAQNQSLPKNVLKEKQGEPVPPKKVESLPKPANSPSRPPDKKVENELKTPLYFLVGQLLVNLKGDQERKNQNLRIKIQLLMSEPDALEYLRKRVAQVKDITRGELENNSAEDLQQAEKREELKQKILRKISQLFPANKEARKWKDPQPIKKVLFEEMIIQ
ncbi:MAG: flagellar basal body-associated FliL family protein [SAR324 cluster bacterium]|nr:flagellar basal body-associated FliL family protein [SAR324 cluster bacterium]